MSHSFIDAPVQKPPNTPPQSSINGRAVELAENAKRPGPFWRLLSVMLGGIGPLFVLSAFTVVFYFGHHYDWKVPKFAELTGSAKNLVADWCEEHSVPESKCVECDPTLMPRGPDYEWCPEHGVHNCPLHHPDVAELKETPVVLADDRKRAARALALHDRKENNSECKVYKTRIQFASVESVRQAGVDVELVERQSIVESVSGSGEILYDPTRLAGLASRVPGTVWLVQKNVGDQVQKGELLAIVDATQVGEIKIRLLKALTEEQLQQENVLRLRKARDIVPGKLVLTAEATYKKARAEVVSAEQMLRNLGLPADVKILRGLSERDAMNRLRFLGIPDAFQSRLSAEVRTANLLPIYSSINGVVVDRAVTPGEVVDPSRILFRVADMSQMWLTLNIPLEHMEQLAIGQTVRFRADGSRHEVESKLDWISTSTDQQTRMVQVRAVLPNLKGRLRNETFGTGEVILRQEPNAIVIPTGASHWEGCCQVVFVRDKHYFDSPDSPKVFHVRSVRLGASNNNYTEVISGVLPGEVIATAGSDVLRAQLLKNNLGEGCACVAE
ncbi:efflux RND transporter periplasmic adaptor subunit [uncultured Gimesia sp.]|uniref:efflux RND transporter periplasmic adaptor subunit n=1 Tax=uncultured Gimesia sp. TaxID=1678688 RepID=UPI0030DA0870|tara:strand:+ start:10420 stop:12090 length:1671 start_codon:yes stop_codon:yes gene_type:complete